MHRYLSATLAFLLLLSACSKEDQAGPTQTPTASRDTVRKVALSAILHAQPGFSWLPPIAPASPIESASDTSRYPTVTICRIENDICGTVVASFLRSNAGGASTVRLSSDNLSYAVNGLDPEKRTRGLCGSRRLTELPFVLQGTEIAERRVSTHRIVPVVDEGGDLALRVAL